MAAMSEVGYDVFVSYAKEDEAFAAELASLLSDTGLRVFFAKQQMISRHHNAQEFLIRQVRRSRSVLLVWSRWVDKSEWVALEMSVLATTRATTDGINAQRIVVVDRGGPLLPPWIPCDRVCAAGDAHDLLTLLTTPLWWQPSSGAARDRPSSVLASAVAIALEVLFDLAAWNTRCRSVILRVGPKLSISDLRKDDMSNVALACLIRDSFVAATLPIVAALIVTFALWLWVLPFPIDRQGYVPRAILISTTSALAAVLLISLRIGLAAAIAGGIGGAVSGSTVALIAVFYDRPESWAGGVTVGVMFGATVAIALRVHEMSARSIAAFSLRWAPLLGVLFTFALVASGQYLAERWGPNNESSALSRAVFAACVGAVIFLPIGGITAWFAHLQVRLRYRFQAIGVGLGVWFGLIVVIAAAAALVPFGNPFDLRDGLGVGLLAGAVAAGLLTILAASFSGVVGPAHSALCAGVALLLIGLPILRLFPNIEAGRIYLAVCVSAVLTFVVFLTPKFFASAAGIASNCES
jgi:hypothetical protein